MFMHSARWPQNPKHYNDCSAQLPRTKQLKVRSAKFTKATKLFEDHPVPKPYAMPIHLLASQVRRCSMHIGQVQAIRHVDNVTCSLSAGTERMSPILNHALWIPSLGSFPTPWGIPYLSRQQGEPYCFFEDAFQRLLQRKTNRKISFFCFCSRFFVFFCVCVCIVFLGWVYFHQYPMVLLEPSGFLESSPRKPGRNFTRVAVGLRGQGQAQTRRGAVGVMGGLRRPAQPGLPRAMGVWVWLKMPELGSHTHTQLLLVLLLGLVLGLFVFCWLSVVCCVLLVICCASARRHSFRFGRAPRHPGLAGGCHQTQPLPDLPFLARMRAHGKRPRSNQMATNTRYLPRG